MRRPFWSQTIIVNHPGWCLVAGTAAKEEVQHLRPTTSLGSWRHARMKDDDGPCYCALIGGLGHLFQARAPLFDARPPPLAGCRDGKWGMVPKDWEGERGGAQPCQHTGEPGRGRWSHWHGRASPPLRSAHPTGFPKSSGRSDPTDRPAPAKILGSENPDRPTHAEPKPSAKNTFILLQLLLPECACPLPMYFRVKVALPINTLSRDSRISKYQIIRRT